MYLHLKLKYIPYASYQLVFTRDVFTECASHGRTVVQGGQWWFDTTLAWADANMAEFAQQLGSRGTFKIKFIKSTSKPPLSP